MSNVNNETHRDRQNATMMLVGDIANRTAILIDDLADTSNTITRAAKLLKKEGAKKVYALITHGVYVKYRRFLGLAWLTYDTGSVGTLSRELMRLRWTRLL